MGSARERGRGGGEWWAKREGKEKNEGAKTDKNVIEKYKEIKGWNRQETWS